MRFDDSWYRLFVATYQVQSDKQGSPFVNEISTEASCCELGGSVRDTCRRVSFLMGEALTYFRTPFVVCVPLFVTSK